jgi:hypothetical protein
MARPAGTIVAVVGEDGRYDHVRRRAIERARDGGAPLVLFDVDAGSTLLESPRPTNWSADGEEQQYGDRLTVNELEALGRAPLADQVRDARARGVEAYGWVPEKNDADGLREYAESQGASLVLVPDEEIDLGEDLASRVEVVAAAG